MWCAEVRFRETPRLIWPTSFWRMNLQQKRQNLAIVPLVHEPRWYETSRGNQHVLEPTASDHTGFFYQNTQSASTFTQVEFRKLHDRYLSCVCYTGFSTCRLNSARNPGFEWTSSADTNPLHAVNCRSYALLPGDKARFGTVLLSSVLWHTDFDGLVQSFDI